MGRRQPVPHWARIKRDEPKRIKRHVPRRIKRHVPNGRVFELAILLYDIKQEYSHNQYTMQRCTRKSANTRKRHAREYL